ncbi:MAG: ABC transporter substrate-binding protein [Bacteroidetes bacterium]|nr:ABC transporter substrate-binding protein [Bacteroidota bacterium]
MHILLVVIGCNNVDNSQNAAFFRYNEDAAITTLDPAFVRNQAEIWACSQIFEGLVEFDDNLNIVPCIAKEWEISNSNKTYRFKLKDNVFFIDYQGKQRRKLTAQDFVYSFSRLVKKENASPGSWIFNDKIDLTLFENGSEQDTAFPFRAVNDSIFEINLTIPFAPFLSLLANPYCFVVMPEEAEKQGKEFRSRPTGTGPFRFVRWDEDVQMLLHQNPFYHETSKKGKIPYLQGILIDLNKNKQAAFMGFIAGKYDFFNGINPNIKDELFTQNGTLKQKYQKDFTLKSTPFLNSEFIGFYIDKTPPGMNKDKFAELRKMLNLATNRAEIITFLKNGLGSPADRGFVPYGIASYDSVRTAGLAFAPLKAEAWMKSQGYNANTTLKLTLNTTADYVDIAVLLKNQWKKIYVDLTIEIHPGSFLRQLRNQGKALLFRASWIADYPDPDNFMAYFYSPFHSPNGPNYTHFTNEECDQLYVKSMSEPDTKIRMKYLAQMDSIVSAECPVLFLYYDKSVRLVSNRVQGLEANPMNFLRLKYVSKNNDTN